MMEPILQKMDKQYEGKAAVIFVDVRYHQEEARRFHINGIPTQIFFDKTGNEIYRHTGYHERSGDRRAVQEDGR